MRFIDLFAGLGGFHKALHELGHNCVFASELDPTLREVYKENWGIEPKGDIKEIVKREIDSIPDHEILCAGFPCQPFSKAGKQLGREDKERGTLFDDIVKILKTKKPKYFILENVPFLAKHNNEETWTYMQKRLENLGYKVDHRNYSPHDFGIPQHRLRIFIVGSLVGLNHFNFSEIDSCKSELLDIKEFIEESPEKFRKLPKANIQCIKLWQEFIDCIPKETKLPGFPIWGMEFGATYPFENKFPHVITTKDLGRYKGNFGCSLQGLSRQLQFASLPNYARVEEEFPSWKKRFIRQSREFYQVNKKHVSQVVKEIAKIPSQSWQKLEWNVGNGNRKITNYILQFRASGIRVKKVDFFPSLVCTKTQTPIIGWQKRYITKEEGLKLQALEGLKLDINENAAFKALGNAVNSRIVKLIAEELLIDDIRTAPKIKLTKAFKAIDIIEPILTKRAVLID
jgi:DNA (cytosine-5)-methyltransferase 1